MLLRTELIFGEDTAFCRIFWQCLGKKLDENIGSIVGDSSFWRKILII